MLGLIAADFAAGTGAGAGFVVSVADPTPVLSEGGALDVLGSDETDAGSGWRVEGIVSSSSIGLFVMVEGDDVMPTATGVSPLSYDDLGDGDELSDLTAYVVSDSLAAGIDSSAASLGYTGTVEEDGLLLVLVRDAGHSPVKGAVVSCGDCATPAYYFDEDSSDGLFTHSGKVNEQTGISGLVAIPGGSIANYEAEADGRSGSQLAGALPGLAAFVAITVD